MTASLLLRRVSVNQSAVVATGWIGPGRGLSGRPIWDALVDLGINSSTIGAGTPPETVAENCSVPPALTSTARGATVTDKDWEGSDEDDALPPPGAPQP
jgi:hypothetical protein